MVRVTSITRQLSSLTRAAMILLVRAYRATVAPCLPPSCRFEPSCSAYMIEALETHGILRGLLLGAWRILRCNPWCCGGFDPVPDPRKAAGNTAG